MKNPTKLSELRFADLVDIRTSGTQHEYRLRRRPVFTTRNSQRMVVVTHVMSDMNTYGTIIRTIVLLAFGGGLIVASLVFATNLVGVLMGGRAASGDTLLPLGLAAICGVGLAIFYFAKKMLGGEDKRQ